MGEPIGKRLPSGYLGMFLTLAFTVDIEAESLIPLQQVFPGKAARTELDEM